MVNGMCSSSPLHPTQQWWEVWDRWEGILAVRCSQADGVCSRELCIWCMWTWQLKQTVGVSTPSPLYSLDIQKQVWGQTWKYTSVFILQFTGCRTKKGIHMVTNMGWILGKQRKRKEECCIIHSCQWCQNCHIGSWTKFIGTDLSKQGVVFSEDDRMNSVCGRFSHLPQTHLCCCSQ